MLTRFIALALLTLAASGRLWAQTTTVILDEDDGGTAFVYDASEGGASGADALDLVDGRLPLIVDGAFSGTMSGRLTYTHTTAGTWSVLVGAPGFSLLDLTEADSVAVYLSGPGPIAGRQLPTFALEDADGNRSAPLALNFNGLFGLDADRSVFTPGSTTDALFLVENTSGLPLDEIRPGYPENLTIPFFDTAVTTSTAGIGLPAVPANFRIVAASGLELPFRFRDVDGDGTLSRLDEFIEVLTAREGTTSLRSTFRITPVGSVPTSPPHAGDVFQVRVYNSGVDGDPGTWQRRGFALGDFGPLGDLELARIRGVRFSNPDETTPERTLWIDFLHAVDVGEVPPGPDPPTELVAETGDRSILLRWAPAIGAAGVRVYRRADGESLFRLVTATRVTQDHYADLDVDNGRTYTYVLRSEDASRNQGPDSDPFEAAPEAGAPDVYIDLTARLAFDFFWNEANPANGLIKDRSTAGSASSIASVGFGLSAITVAIDRGWITREQGVARVLNTLNFFATCPQGPEASGVCGYRGFFYHFLDMQTGMRRGTTELSTIDTALLLGGVLHAQMYFDGDGADEAAIRQRAEEIYHRVEWDWSAHNSPLVTLSWRPEEGFSTFDWRGYNEAMILYILGLGSPTHPLPDDAWDGWTSTYNGDWGTFYGYTYLSFPPLFGHQYSHVWIDFRGISDAYMRARGLDYFENSRRATLANRAYCIANPGGFPNYGPNEWGLTASDDPFGYRAHGAPPAQADNGTITPTAAGGSYAFTPDLSREALRHFYQTYRTGLWGPYGLRDAYNVEESWFGSAYLGIDQGPILLMIENERTGAIWDSFMQHPAIQTGLERAGFAPFVAGESEAVRLGTTLDPVRPNPSARRAEVAFTLAEAGTVRLSIVDALGREVAVLLDGPSAAGEHVAAVETGSLAAGLYLARLQADEAVFTRSFVVAR